MRTGEFWEAEEFLSSTPAQTTEEAACNLPNRERYGAIMANIDENNGVNISYKS